MHTATVVPGSAPVRLPVLPLATLGIRTVGFLGVQLAIALALMLRGKPASESASFFLVSAAITNLATLVWLRSAQENEGSSLHALWLPTPRAWKTDLKWFLLTLLVSGPLGVLPMQWLSSALWGDEQMGSRLMFTAAPAWVWAGAGLVFVLTQPFAELPAYFGFAMPRLKEAFGSRVLAVGLAAFALSVQHVTLPLLWDWRFAAWRALMFLPFALVLAAVVDRRPSLLPWLMAVHFLMDAQLPVLVALVSTGKMAM